MNRYRKDKQLIVQITNLMIAPDDWQMLLFLFSCLSFAVPSWHSYNTRENVIIARHFTFRL